MRKTHRRYFEKIMSRSVLDSMLTDGPRETTSRISSRHDRNATALDVVAGIELHGKVALVTGGGAGIGLETVRALATAGAEVYVADVDTIRSPAALDAVVAQIGKARIHFLKLDLGVLSDVAQFARDFLALGVRLDLLINNAGIMACPQGRTADGHERQFGVNYLGHYALTRALEPVLTWGGPTRLISVSSIGHRRSDIHYGDIDFHKRPYDRWDAYGQSKTACALLAVGAWHHWGDRGLVCNSVNPGGSPTDLHRFLSIDERRAQGWLDTEDRIPDRWRAPAQCAATSVWLATAPELAGVGGRYFEECHEAVPWRAEEPMVGVRPYALSRENALRLWDVSAAMLA